MNYLDQPNKTEKSLAEKANKIQNPILSVEQIVAILAKTPKQYKYTRPAKGGGTWTYVSGGYVKKTLNRVFGWRWSFQVVDKWKEDNEVIVQGRLTILNDEGEPCIIKEDIGNKEIMTKKNSNLPLSIGNDYKSATTDALKRCAYQLGFASDVYAPQEFREFSVDTAEDSIEQSFQRNCEVCGDWFDTDKRFVKECKKCYNLSKEEKKKTIEDREKKIEAEKKALKGQPFNNLT
jgi:hypothetical protein